MPENRSEKSKKLKTTKSKSGAQLFMSDEAKEQMRNRPFEGAEIENLVRKSMTDRMLEGKITPKKSGRTKAETYIDMSSRSHGNDTQNFMMGGEVRPGDVRDSGKRGKCY